MQRKAQGLPINTIILIAIGLLILVVLVLFVTKSFAGLGASTSTSGTAASAFEGQCSNACATASSSNTVPLQFCTQTDTIAASNGKPTLYTCSNITTVTAGSNGCQLQNGTTFYSYQSPSGLTCSATCVGPACK